jgi:hypothetical protein
VNRTRETEHFLTKRDMEMLYENIEKLEQREVEQLDSIAKRVERLECKTAPSERGANKEQLAFMEGYEVGRRAANRSAQQVAQLCGYNWPNLDAAQIIAKLVKLINGTPEPD